jgi:N-acetylglucosaminyldiphosphoundecaprenol N-acetyl-beta-D-mannosaminyltransferase
MTDSNDISPRLESTQTIDVLGFPVQGFSPQDVWRVIDHALSDRKGRSCLHVVTLNPEYVMAARKDPEFAAAIRRADLITADGVGVAMSTRIDRRSRSKVERVTGVEIVRHLAEQSRDVRVPLFLLGADPGVAADAAWKLDQELPGVTIAGWWSEGSAEPIDDREAISRIHACGARAVAVAYGARGQVMWIDRNRDELSAAGVRVAVGVGGAFDFIAGRVPRAPAFVQRIGLEWLYRLVREPWRWRRQLVLPQFALLVLKDRFLGGRRER